MERAHGENGVDSGWRLLHLLSSGKRVINTNNSGINNNSRRPIKGKIPSLLQQHKARDGKTPDETHKYKNNRKSLSVLATRRRRHRVVQTNSTPLELSMSSGRRCKKARKNEEQTILRKDESVLSVLPDSVHLQPFICLYRRIYADTIYLVIYGDVHWYI